MATEIISFEKRKIIFDGNFFQTNNRSNQNNKMKMKKC